MDSYQTNDADWNEDGFSGSITNPSVSMSSLSGELPSLTVTAVVGLSMVILLVIAAVFLLGVLFDCRQQKLLEQKINEAKRQRNQRRVRMQSTREEDCIITNMEETGESSPPVLDIQTTP